jgi:hypothetical protein
MTHINLHIYHGRCRGLFAEAERGYPSDCWSAMPRSLDKAAQPGTIWSAHANQWSWRECKTIVVL